MRGDRRLRWASSLAGQSVPDLRAITTGWTDDQLRGALDYAIGLERDEPSRLDWKLLRIALREVWHERGPTVRQARAEVEQKLMRGGSTCPCCGRNAKAYHRKFSALMAATTIWLTRRSEYHQTITFVGQPGTEAYMRGHGWVQWAKEAPDTIHRLHEISRVVAFELAHESSATGFSGWYMPTKRAHDFIRGRSTVPAGAWTWDRGVLAFDGEEITIREALGVRFDLDELLQSRLEEPARWLPKS